MFSLHVLELFNAGLGVALANLTEGLVLVTASLLVLLVELVFLGQLGSILGGCQLASQFLEEETKVEKTCPATLPPISKSAFLEGDFPLHVQRVIASLMIMRSPT